MLVRVYRFADRRRPQTLQPRLVESPALVRLGVRGMLLMPAWRQRRADLHARGKVRNSPYVSVLEDHRVAARTPDPWLSCIVHGQPPLPGVHQAPDLGEFDTPPERVVTPSVWIAVHETEVLYEGDDLGHHVVRWVRNPY